mmetsp:Transcript_32755/g.81564  ORF Transcript_32755/g.81564 Transcript_32755/m.81564 type:complete len:256 (+) Transcript_32755:121-888(+)
MLEPMHRRRPTWIREGEGQPRRRLFSIGVATLRRAKRPFFVRQPDGLLSLQMLLIIVLQDGGYRDVHLHYVGYLLEDAYGRSQLPYDLHERIARQEVRDVHRHVPELRPRAHDEEHRLPVVEPEQAVLDLLVRAEAQLEAGVHVVPVGEHVERDEAAEGEEEVRVEVAEDDAEAGGGGAVGDHVEDGAEAGVLPQQPCGEAVGGVEALGDEVAAEGDAPVTQCTAIPDESEEDAGVADEVGDEEGRAVRHGDGGM